MRAHVMAVGLAALAGLLGAFEADFELGDSALFTDSSAFNGVGGSSVIDWTWDSGDHVQQTGTQINIPPAPRTTDSSTLVARLGLNNSVAGARHAATVVLFPNVPVLTELTSLRVDVWGNYAGNSGGAAGASRLVIIGVAESIVPAPSNFASSSFNGAFYALSVEHGLEGSGSPHRYYEGIAGPANQPSFANYFGTDATSVGSPEWQALFPNPTYQSIGAMGKAWTTLELRVDPGTSTIQLWITPEGGSAQLVSTRELPGISTDRVFIGTLDLGSALSSVTPSDNFLLLDNVYVGPPGGPSTVGDWMLLGN